MRIRGRRGEIILRWPLCDNEEGIAGTDTEAMVLDSCRGSAVNGIGGPALVFAGY